MKIQIHEKMSNRLIKGIIIGIFLISIFPLALAGDKSSITNSATPTTVEGEKSLIDYKFDWGQTNISLYRLVNIYEVEINKTYFNEISKKNYTVIENETVYNYTISNNIYIESKEKGWKFGANDASLTESETARYKYVLNSTDELISLHKESFDEKGNFTYKYPIVYNYYLNSEDEWDEFRHIYDFKDVCSKSYSGCEWLWYGNSIEIFFTSDKNIDPLIENISSCKTLDKSNQTYQLTQSLSTTGDCIVVSGYNVTFDLNGHSITGDDDANDYGIAGSSDYTGGSSDYLTVKNGYIYDFGRGFYSSSDYITIENMTVSSSGYGIYLSSNHNNILTDNTVYYGSDVGIYLYSSSNNTLQNNDASHNHGYGSSGIVLTGGSNNNQIRNNIVNNNTDNGIIIGSSSNNKIIDTNISNSKNYYDVKLNSNSTNNIFLNTTYNISKENVASGSELIRKWYYRAYVNDTAGNPLDFAIVKIYNKTDNLQTQLITGNDSYATFDGNGDCIEIYGSWGVSSPLNIYNKDITISSWARWTGFGNTIVARATGSYITYWLRVETNKACVRIYTGGQHKSVCTGGILEQDIWYHIVGVFDRVNNKGIVYIDGILKANDTLPDAPAGNNEEKTKIGCRNNANDNPFSGTIDNVMIFNKSLTAEEIDDLYKLGKRDYTYNNINLISAWRFDDPTQSKAIDSIGDYNGTFYGDTGYETIEYDSGFTEQYEIIDYINNGGTRSYFSNYTIYADKTCYPSYRIYHNVTHNIFDVLTLGSSTYQNWNWNFADNCNLLDMPYNIENYNITSYNSGTWTLNNTAITTTNFDMNSSGDWDVIASKIKIIGS